jgi:hypothetical protein
VQVKVWARLTVATAAAALLGGVAVTASPVVAAGASQHVKPGAVVVIADVHCKVGVMLHQGRTVYAGVPANCGALPLNEGHPQWGCGHRGTRQTSASAPVGTPVRIAGAQHRSILVYDSFTRMQATGVRKLNKCQFNELILLKLSKVDAAAARGSARHVASTPPRSGMSLSLGRASATAASSTHHGWVYPLSSAPPVTATDVGTPLAHGSTLVGMLTAIPQGTLNKTPTAAYNLSRAITYARHAPGFHHLKLLKA